MHYANNLMIELLTTGNNKTNIEMTQLHAVFTSQANIIRGSVKPMNIRHTLHSTLTAHEIILCCFFRSRKTIVEFVHYLIMLWQTHT